MESIIIACITGEVFLAGGILSNSKSRAVTEVKLMNARRSHESKKDLRGVVYLRAWWAVPRVLERAGT
jgi:hypothetical protein